MSCCPEEEGWRDSFELPCHKQHLGGQKVTKIGLWREGFSFLFAVRKWNLKQVTKPVFLCFPPCFACLSPDYELLAGVTMSHCGCAHDGTMEECGGCWGSSTGVSCLQTLPSVSLGAVGYILCTSWVRLLTSILHHLKLTAAGSEVVDHFRSLRLIFFLYILSYFLTMEKSLCIKWR